MVDERSWLVFRSLIHKPTSNSTLKPTVFGGFVALDKHLRKGFTIEEKCLDRSHPMSSPNRWTNKSAFN